MLDKKYLTVEQAAEVIGCSIGNVRHMILDDKLPAEKFGKCWVIERKHAEIAARNPAKTGRPRKVQK